MRGAPERPRMGAGVAGWGQGVAGGRDLVLGAEEEESLRKCRFCMGKQAQGAVGALEGRGGCDQVK